MSTTNSDSAGGGRSGESARFGRKNERKQKRAVLLLLKLLKLPKTMLTESVCFPPLGPLHRGGAKSTAALLAPVAVVSVAVAIH
jgi:hypothetical protein